MMDVNLGPFEENLIHHVIIISFKKYVKTKTKNKTKRN